MKIKERGYFTLNTPEGDKTARLGSRTFISQMKEYTGKDIATFGDEMKNTEDEDAVFDYFSTLLYVGMVTHCLEQDLEQDFNKHKVDNYLWDGMQEDDTIISRMFEALTSALPKAKEVKGSQKS